MGTDRRVQLVYDMECPMCDLYCRLVRIRDTVGALELIDARDGGEIVDRVTAAGLDIDEGIVLIVDDEMYYGAEGMHRLALMSTESGVFNRLAYRAFRSRRVSMALYPVFKACRNLLLKLLRRTRINNLGLVDNDRF